MVKPETNERIGRSSAAKPIPHIPLPFEEVMKDVLRVKPPEKPPSKPRSKKRQKSRKPPTKAAWSHRADTTGKSAQLQHAN